MRHHLRPMSPIVTYSGLYLCFPKTYSSWTPRPRGPLRPASRRTRFSIDQPPHTRARTGTASAHPRLGAPCGARCAPAPLARRTSPRRSACAPRRAVRRGSQRRRPQPCASRLRSDQLHDLKTTSCALCAPLNISSTAPASPPLCVWALCERRAHASASRKEERKD